MDGFIRCGSALSVYFGECIWLTQKYLQENFLNRQNRPPHFIDAYKHKPRVTLQCGATCRPSWVVQMRFAGFSVSSRSLKSLVRKLVQSHSSVHAPFESFARSREHTGRLCGSDVCACVLATPPPPPKVAGACRGCTLASSLPFPLECPQLALVCMYGGNAAQCDVKETDWGLLDQSVGRCRGVSPSGSLGGGWVTRHSSLPTR